MYCLLNVTWVVRIREDGTSRSFGMYQEEEQCALGFYGESEGKSLLQMPGQRWKDNFKMDLK